MYKILIVDDEKIERNENSIRKDADGGLPQIGQAAVFAQKWRYHAYF